MPRIRLTLLVGRHAQAHYLPIVHPSPLNFRWHGRNPWFVTEVIPDLRRYVSDALAGTSATQAGPANEDAVD